MNLVKIRYILLWFLCIIISELIASSSGTDSGKIFFFLFLIAYYILSFIVIRKAINNIYQKIEEKNANSTDKDEQYYIDVDSSINKNLFIIQKRIILWIILTVAVFKMFGINPYLAFKIITISNIFNV